MHEKKKKKKSNHFQMELMELSAVIRLLLALLAVPLTSLPSFLLLSYLTSILPVKRNIFTHMDTLFLKIALAKVYSGVSLEIHHLFNRPCVAGPVLQTALSLIHSVTQLSFSS